MDPTTPINAVLSRVARHRRQGRCPTQSSIKIYRSACTKPSRSTIAIRRRLACEHSPSRLYIAPYACTVVGASSRAAEGRLDRRPGPFRLIYASTASLSTCIIRAKKISVNPPKSILRKPLYSARNPHPRDDDLPVREFSCLRKPDNDNFGALPLTVGRNALRIIPGMPLGQGIVPVASGLQEPGQLLVGARMVRFEFDGSFEGFDGGGSFASPRQGEAIVVMGRHMA